MRLQSKEFLISMQDLQVCRDATRAKLAAESLRISGRLFVRVHGTSMLGTIWPGDILNFERCSAGDVRLGDIVLYRREDRLIAHRVIAILRTEEQTTFLTRGDSLRGTDLPVAADEVLGRAVGVHREGWIPRGLSKERTTIRQVFSSVVARSNLICEIALRVHALYTRFASASPTPSCESSEAAMEAQS